MRSVFKTLIAGFVAALIATVGAQAAPFGEKGDVDYSKALWTALEKMKFVGKDAIQVRPFEGNEPHGSIQEVLASTATVNGHTGRVVVKRNHGRKGGLTVEEVYDNPNKFLGAVTVMFKRESGFDAENKDWFWVKYKPDGSLHTNPKGMMLAGKVAKGKEMGCIACHTAAGGADLETLTSK